MEIVLVMVLVHDRNIVETHKRSIMLANYKQQVTLAQVNKRFRGQESKKVSLMLITCM